MSDIYKYRVGKKWYSFDKSILEPEDLRVFNLADWKDKLKIITIYQELKPSDNDDVVILKSKTEKPTKDKRAAEYRAKKQKLESELTDANEKNDGVKQQRLVKELQQLDIEYADIVNIQNAETVNIAKANQVILKDVNELIKETNDTLKELKPNLNALDFKTINDLVEKLLDASNKQQLDETITQIKNTLTQLNKSSLIPEVNKGVRIMTDTMEQLKGTIADIKESETVNKLLELGLIKDIDVENQSYLKTLSMILSKIDKLNISEDDLSTLSRYPKAIDYLKTQQNPFKVVNPLCYLINFYVKWLRLKEDDEVKAIGFDEHKTDRAVKGKFKYDITKPVEFEKFIDKLRIADGNNRFDLFYKYGGKDTKQFIGTYDFNKADKNVGTNKIIKTIVDNKQIEEVDKPAAVEGDGFLGLKTNKAAKKEYEQLTKQLMDEITKLKQQVEQMNAEINDLKTKYVKSSNELQQEEKPQIGSESLTAVPLSEPTNSNDIKTVKPTFLTDITQGNTQLKHIEPQPKAPELTDLEKLLNRRRQDIEPDLTDSEDSEDWGAGVGGLLGELQRDLNKYGLVLSLSPDKNAYFINVFNRKQKKANGVAEASKLVNSVNQDTEYKDLKKLYEQLY